tara:strand:- start:7558 stop:7890 length:333 start_codon:yes stop_codon:yes gene_type:complete
MKRRKAAWRNAAYEYIKTNGPSTAERLLSDMKTKRGRLWTDSNKGPAHANGASQLLKSDPRFTCTWVKRIVVTGVVGANMGGRGSRSRQYSNYKVREWRIADEKSQTDTE